jgi:hypothetical protein
VREVKRERPDLSPRCQHVGDRIIFKKAIDDDKRLDLSSMNAIDDTLLNH